MARTLTADDEFTLFLAVGHTVAAGGEPRMGDRPVVCRAASPPRVAIAVAGEGVERARAGCWNGGDCRRSPVERSFVRPYCRSKNCGRSATCWHTVGYLRLLEVARYRVRPTIRVEPTKPGQRRRTAGLRCFGRGEGRKQPASLHDVWHSGL
jgi:hypothetical protein